MDYLPIFVAVTSIAVVVQAGILIGMFLALRELKGRVETVATQLTGSVLPTVDLAQTMLAELRPRLETISTQITTTVMPTVALAQSMLADLRPRIENIATNISESTTTIRGQIVHLDATVSEALERARLQVIRTDELVGRAIDRVEETSESVQRTVSAPVRQFSGLVRGVSAGLGYLVTNKKHRETAPADEMFI